MQRKLRLGLSSIALIALIVAGCSTAAHRQAQLPGWATQEAWAEFKACVKSVMDQSEYAALFVHTLDLDTMQPTTTQLTDETIPSEQDARVFAARFDETNRCREELLTDIAIPRPDLTPILADEFTQAGAIAVLVVERRVTWAEAARRSQMLSGDLRQGSQRLICNGLLISTHSTKPTWRNFKPPRRNLNNRSGSKRRRDRPSQMERVLFVHIN